MRIIHTGIFIASMMRPISQGGFWMGFFSLALLIPVGIAVHGIVKFYRLKRHGIKTYATINKTVKVHFRNGYHYDKYYDYTAENAHFGGMFSIGYKSKRYADHQKIEVRYEKDNPQKHIRINDSLWESIAVLFLTGIVFVCTFSLFMDELLKCFR